MACIVTIIMEQYNHKSTKTMKKIKPTEPNFFTIRNLNHRYFFRPEWENTRKHLASILIIQKKKKAMGFDNTSKEF